MRDVLLIGGARNRAALEIAITAGQFAVARHNFPALGARFQVQSDRLPALGAHIVGSEACEPQFGGMKKSSSSVWYCRNDGLR